MKRLPFIFRFLFTLGGACLVAVAVVCVLMPPPVSTTSRRDAPPHPTVQTPLVYQPAKSIDTSGYWLVTTGVRPWAPDASLETIADSWRRAGYRDIERLAPYLSRAVEPAERTNHLLVKAALLNYEGEPGRAHEILQEARSTAERDERLAHEMLYTLVFYQGVSALRRGENENCIMCRGESSCILPIAPSARHTNPAGSRLAIKHFTEYLSRFPDDLEVRWLLNLAHMTLGEYPDQVDPRFLLSIDRWLRSEFDIGRFRDIGHLAGVNRLNQAGGAIMEDFDNDGMLDLVVTSFDPTESMAFYHNQGDGTFEDRSQSAGMTSQLGGLYCVQTDYNNDGLMDIYIPRGAWLSLPMRPTLLRNKGGGTFADVTKEAGLLVPVNSNSASWADYDNDGWLDLFVCCEKQANLLYHNKGDGTFEEVAARAGVNGDGQPMCKGAAWFDFDNDCDPDLFLNYLSGLPRLFRNEGDGRFTSVTTSMGIDGPSQGFSCWAWDYDNDGWLDIFATSYDRKLKSVIKGLMGEPDGSGSNRLYRNLNGRGFADVTRESGLDAYFAPMGSNYGDFDNDGYLDMYLGTGWPNLQALVPNRMFRNVVGKRFAEITASSGTGNLQKGHAVACGDWDRDGDTDIFIQMGGAVNGDKYHNVLFDNPGQGNHWLTLKLVGKKTNRAAIGARIKVVTDGENPLTVQRHVSSGSSFGANTLEQTIGLGRSQRIASLEIHWPTSGTTQVFRDLKADQSIEVTEFAEGYRQLARKPIPRPR